MIVGHAEPLLQPLYGAWYVMRRVDVHLSLPSTLAVGSGRKLVADNGVLCLRRNGRPRRRSLVPGEVGSGHLTSTCGEVKLELLIFFGKREKRRRKEERGDCRTVS